MRWVVLTVLAMPAQAEPMNGAAVAVFWGQDTVTYEADGVVVGWEDYRPDRQVVWKTAGGGCEFGTWAEGPEGQICFTYDGDTAPVCWRFDQSGGVVTAQSVADPAAPRLTATLKTPEPLICPGPEVGV